MIKTSVTRHDVFASSFVDKFGFFLDDKSLEEAAKRINMHDELVKSLDEMCAVWRLVCNSSGWDENHMSQYENAIKLLEKCK